MAWIESHTVLQRHRKLIGLAGDLKIRRSHAMGHLHALWHSAIEQQEDGNLAAWSDPMIAEMADFPGDPRRFVALLKRHRWLERDRRLHDWWDYAGPFLRSKYKRTNEKWERIRALYVPVTATVTSPPNRTVPTVPTIPTLPNRGGSERFKRCDWKDGSVQCSESSEIGAHMCRAHIDKAHELKSNPTRSGAWKV